MPKKYRLAILETHPISYKIPIYEKLARHQNIDLMVYFCSDFGLKKDYFKEYDREIDWEINNLNFKHKFLKNYWPKKKKGLQGTLLNLGILKEILLKKYDIIFIQGYSPLINKLVILLSLLTETSIIFKEEIDFLKKQKGIKKSLKNFFFSIFLKKFDSILYGYSKNKEFYESYKVNKKNLFFTPCSVDNEKLQKQKKILKSKKDLKKELKLSEKSFVVIFVGRLIPIKRPLDIIKAVENMKNKNKVDLLIIGGGREEENIANYIKRKGLKNIHLLGFKKPSELAKYYSVSDVFVLASSEDRSPKSLNEAMNFELPAIVTDQVATAPDLIKNGENGFIYPVGDIQKLINYLNLFSTNKKLLNRAKKKSGKIIKEWSFDNYVNGLIRAIKHVYKNKNYSD